MRVSQKVLSALIAEAITETIGLDHSNRGRQKPLENTGPVVEDEYDDEVADIQNRPQPKRVADLDAGTVFTLAPSDEEEYAVSQGRYKSDFSRQIWHGGGEEGAPYMKLDHYKYNAVDLSKGRIVSIGSSKLAFPTKFTLGGPEGVEETESPAHRSRMLGVADDLEDASDDIEDEYLGEYERITMNTHGPRGYGRYLVDDEGNMEYLGPASDDDWADEEYDLPKDYGMYDDERYEEVKRAVREALAEEKDKGNPWAICTSSVGRDDKAKYERCVQDVKKETGYKG